MAILFLSEQLQTMTDEEIRLLISGDANKALALINGGDFHGFSTSGFYDFGWQVRLIDHDGTVFEKYHQNFARAICEAWIAWRQEHRA